MKLRWGLYLAIVAAPAVRAGVLDVTSLTSAVMRTGDTLSFELLTSNYGVNAGAFGLAEFPSAVAFDLVTAPGSVTGGFAATLESGDRGTSVAFGSLTYGAGFIQGSGYTGVVTTVEGWLQLSPVLSEALFGGGSVTLLLQNQGPDVTVGLSPYTLRQDMYASLSGGPLSLGAVTAAVSLESHAGFPGLIGPAASTGMVPEPGAGSLLFSGGTLLCGLSALLARLSRRRR